MSGFPLNRTAFRPGSGSSLAWPNRRGYLYFIGWSQRPGTKLGGRDQMRPILVLFTITVLMGCVADEVPLRHNNVSTTEIPGIRWKHDKHKNYTEASGPVVGVSPAGVYYIVGGSYYLTTQYTHKDGLQSRRVSATSPNLIVYGADLKRITSAYSYGEEFTVVDGIAVLVTRKKLWEYARSSKGWELEVTTKAHKSYEIHISANYIREFLDATPECEALEDCEIPTT